MNAAYSRDTGGAKRREKPVKEKKHSKERKHKERNSGGVERERESDNTKGSGGERDRRGGGGSAVNLERRVEHHRKDEHHSDPERERYHQRSGFEREERGGEIRGGMIANSERRFQKHYERGSGHSGGGRGAPGNHNYHHHNQQQQQYHHHHHHQVPPHMHMHQQHRASRQPDYYERPITNFHLGPPEHHGGRHQSQYGVGVAKHGGYASAGGAQMDYEGGGHHDAEMQRERGDRRKHGGNYEQPKDAESLEQDLRSRLLSKRHKYVKAGNDAEEVGDYEARSGGERRSENDRERHEHNYDEREKAVGVVNKSHRNEKRRGENVIEVLDSPDVIEEDPSSRQRRKHKRHTKEKPAEVETSEKVLESSATKTERRRIAPDDPELVARRAKLLTAERETKKRKESAREELEARRVMRRERGADPTDTDALSPSAVAASVAAGLGVIIKRKKNETDEQHVKRRKRAKKTSKESNEEDDDYADDDEEEAYEKEGSESEDDDDDSISMSLSLSDSTESEKSYTKKSKSKQSNREGKSNVSADDDIDVQLPESPLSIGELSKTPVSASKKHRSKKHTKRNTDDEESSVHSVRSSSPSFRRTSRSPLSRSHSPLSHTSRSRSRSHSVSRSRSRSSRRHLHRHHSSRSRSNSRSRSATSRSRSRSRSRERSRTRSEERHMKSHQRNKDAADVSDVESPSKTKRLNRHGGGGDSSASPMRDDKGAPLPNYFPGIQGCRSVEEFQCLNRIEEGTYGVVYRAKDKRTNEIVALKRLKMEKEKEGFPITSLREINTLLKGQHPNIVTVREIVVGSNMDKIFIVMDYVEHDLKSLMETMKTRKQSFFPGEVKCLVQQLLRAVGHLHDNWILHRDLKTSNLLLSHKGILKVGDFGLAREYGSPLKKYTSLVVTLWYRAPELLLCSPEYSTPIDLWSVGCIFAEFLQMLPLFPGKSEIDQLNRIFKELGTPNEKIWPGYKDLPAVKNLLSQNSQFSEYPVSNLRKRFNEKTGETGCSLLQGLLTYDPKQRLNADSALKHPYFKELPLPIDPSMFPTWPAKSELGSRKALASSPKPPSGGLEFKKLGHDDIIVGGAGASGAGKKVVSSIITGNKKTATNTGFVLNAGVEQRQVAMGPGFSLKF